MSTNPPATAPPPAPAGPPNQASIDSLSVAAAAQSAASQLSLSSQQLLSLLTHLPNVFKNTPGDPGKEVAAEVLSNLAQAAGPPQPPAQGGPDQNIHPSLQGQHEPGPSSHPNGPPSLGAPMEGVQQEQQPQQQESPSASEGAKTSSGRRRNGPPIVNGHIMGSEEWARQRKDNHKEVERRRRGNINDGITELSRIVPNGTGEKAKGAILSRAVQYIHHLKENEARNIEKWTLEKLLMDQAMGDLQAQLEELKRGWEEERRAREKADTEADRLRKELEKLTEQTDKSKKRTSASAEAEGGSDHEGKAEAVERGAKRQKTSA